MPRGGCGAPPPGRYRGPGGCGAAEAAGPVPKRLTRWVGARSSAGRPVIKRPAGSARCARSRRAMEPPGTAGAPGAAGRPWEDAKAFYDNLAPKKKPKSVRAPGCAPTAEVAPSPGREPPARGGGWLPGTPRVRCSPGCCAPPACPCLLRPPLPSRSPSECPISSRSPSEHPPFLQVPCGPWVPVSSRCPGLHLCLSGFLLVPSQGVISLRVLGEALGVSRCPPSFAASLHCPWLPEVSPEPLIPRVPARPRTVPVSPQG